MPSKSLARATDTLHRAHAIAQRARMRGKMTEHVAVQRAAVVVSAASIAELEQHIPVTVAKIPSKIWLAGAGYALAAFTKGNMSRVALGAADAFAAVYAYKAAAQVRSKTPSPMVAGLEEIGYVEEA